MAESTAFRTLDGRSAGSWLVLFGFLGLAAIGAATAMYIDHFGHIVTGMNDQIVWGLPHVFAIFMILAASGALNVASIGSVFGKVDYRPFGRLSGLVAFALLAGGLTVLVLDLGRSDRLITFVTHLNLTSVFALNVFLYSGFFGFVFLYLWAMLDTTGTISRAYKPVAFAAFVWRLMLTTGTGSIFGFMVSRSAFHSTIIAPMFIALSLSFGLAAWTLVMLCTRDESADGQPTPQLLKRLRILLATLATVSLYFVAIHFLTDFYTADRRDLARFMAVGGGVYTLLLWGGFVFAGSVVPVALALIPWRTVSQTRRALGWASALIVIGGHCFLYAFIIGGEAFPIEMFPGMKVSSSFYDGVVANYTPRLTELLLGIGGIGVAGLVITVGLWALPMLPGRLEVASASPSGGNS